MGAANQSTGLNTWLRSNKQKQVSEWCAWTGSFRQSDAAAGIPLARHRSFVNLISKITAGVPCRFAWRGLERRKPTCCTYTCCVPLPLFIVVAVSKHMLAWIAHQRRAPMFVRFLSASAAIGNMRSAVDDRGGAVSMGGHRRATR